MIEEVSISSLLLVVCVAICIVAVNKSGARLRTTAYGVLAIALTLGIMYAVTTLLKLDTETMGKATALLLYVVAAFTMWTHAKKTLKPRP